MAKKWQDVEFVDYKERQKRRRLRKREAVQEELASSVGSRMNVTLIIVVVLLFTGAFGALFYVMLEQREFEDDRTGKMYVEIRNSSGEVRFRRYEVDDFQPIGEQKKFQSGFFQTGDQSNLELITFDDTLLKVRSESQFTLDSIEIFSGNQRTKTNLTLDYGEIIFDSRRSAGGLLELHVSKAEIYAGQALFKVEYFGDEIRVKMSQGVARVEGFGTSREITSAEYVQISNDSMSLPAGFNPLSENW